MADFSYYLVFDFQKLYHDILCMETHTHTHTLLGIHRYSLIYSWWCLSFLENYWLILLQIFFWSIFSLLFFLDSIYLYDRFFTFFFFSLCFILYIFCWPTFKFTIHPFYLEWFAVKLVYQITNLDYLKFLSVISFYVLLLRFPFDYYLFLWNFPFFLFSWRYSLYFFVSLCLDHHWICFYWLPFLLDLSQFVLFHSIPVNFILNNRHCTKKI